MSNRDALPPPTQRELFHPRWVYRWIIDCALGWFGTRNLRLFKRGLPFLGLMAFSATLPMLADSDQTSRYEDALEAAEESGDSDAALIAINRLMRHTPDAQLYRFRLAEHHLTTGDHVAAFRLLDSLAPVSETIAGYEAAHRKMVVLSLDESSKIKITPARQLFHLRRLWDRDKDNSRVNELLASIYLERNLPHLAEQHLARIAESSVPQMLRFAEVESSLGKRENALKAAKLAEEMAAKNLAANPESDAARIAWAKTLLLQGRAEEAELRLKILTETDPTDSNQALVEFYTILASRCRKQSRMLRQEALEIVARALQLEPLAPRAAALFSDLVAGGAAIPADLREPLGQAWGRHCREIESTDDGTMLLVGARILKACGQTQEALRFMKAGATASPSLTEDYARMLVEAGQPETARQVLRGLRESINDDGAEATSVRLARLDVLLGNPADAIKRLRDIREPSPAVRRELMRALMASVDREKLEAAESIRQLQPALDAYPQDARLLSRIAELGQQSPEARQLARKVLLAKTTTGDLPAERVFAVLGTAASQAGDYRSAANDLRQALQLTEVAGRTPDPITRNNLAVALLRQPAPEPQEALAAVEAALADLPGQIDLVVTRAEALVALEDWSGAISALTPTLRFRPDDGLIHSLLARAYEGAGNREMAAEHTAKTRKSPD